MALRTDYKDYIPPSDGRAYSITAETGGVSRISDITDYDQVGDTWNATIINQTNEAVNSNTTMVQGMNIPNQLLNTDCIINQRGVYSAAAGYTYDRWVTSSSAMTVSTQANTSPSNAINEIVITKTGAGYFCQPLEGFAENYIGKTITVSVWLKAAAGTLTVYVGGLTQAVTRTGDWQLVQFTGTVTTDSTWYRKGFSIYSSSGTLYLSAPQVVYGDYVGAYHPRVMADDVALCQRFYETSPVAVAYGALAGSTQGMSPVVFNVTKRRKPTLTTNYSGPPALTFDNVTQHGFSGYKGGSTTVVARTSFIFYADAEITSASP